MTIKDCYLMLIAAALFSLCLLYGCQPGTPTGDTNPVPHPSGVSSPAAVKEIKISEFWEAVAQGQTEKVKMIIKAKPEWIKIEDSNKNTPLHIAAMEGKGDIVDLLLKSGAKPNAQNVAGRTPLHETMSGDIAIMLVTKGADKTIKDKEGRNPVELAKKFNKKDFLKRMKDK